MESQVSLPPVKALTSEWFLLNFLEPWTAEDIEKAIEEDVDLLEFILEHKENDSPQVKTVKSTAFQYDLNWTSGEILFWFSQRRPDIYKVLSTVKGVNWVNKHWVKRKNMQDALIY